MPLFNNNTEHSKAIKNHTDFKLSLELDYNVQLNKTLILKKNVVILGTIVCDALELCCVTQRGVCFVFFNPTSLYQ